MDRTTVQDVATCPKCGAAPTQPCTGRRGPRVRLHQQRWDAAEHVLEGREHEARWWWIVAGYATDCVICSGAIEPGEPAAYRKLDNLTMCEQCVPQRGVTPLISDAYRAHMPNT